MAPEFYNRGLVNSSNKMFCRLDGEKPPVSGNAFCGGHYNSVYSIPEFKADHYLKITRGYLYLVDKEGNRFLYAVYKPAKEKFVLISGDESK